MSKKHIFYQSMYTTRKFILGYPDLKQLGAKFKTECQQGTLQNINKIIYQTIIIDCFFKLVKFEEMSKKAIDIGCGPVPTFVETMLAKGMNASGLEPVDEIRKFAQESILDKSRIIGGSAEKTFLSDNSISFVVLNGVLEHVDSPIKTLDEIYRILEPGGVVYVSTTNKYLLRNDEYIKRFYQWYPRILKESYVFMHLHYRPELARYSSRPAVHWFCYSDLCKLGRDAGFFSFYSLIDLVSENDIPIHSKIGSLKRFLLPYIKYNPFFRSFVLTFTGAGSGIFMIKRKE